MPYVVPAASWLSSGTELLLDVGVDELGDGLDEQVLVPGVGDELVELLLAGDGAGSSAATGAGAARTVVADCACAVAASSNASSTAPNAAASNLMAQRSSRTR